MTFNKELKPELHFTLHRHMGHKSQCSTQCYFIHINVSLNKRTMIVAETKYGLHNRENSKHCIR